MSKYFLLLFYYPITLSLSSQIVQLDPLFPTQEDTVTVIYDATQGSGGLIGVDQVYTHTGVITQSGGPGNWQYVQGEWGTDDPNVRMTALGDDLHQIRYHIPSYYDYPPGTQVEELAFVFRNVDGSLEGKTASGGDIFVPIYNEEDGFLGRFLSPSRAEQILTVEDSLEIRAVFSEMADLRLFEGDSLLTEVTESDDINYTYSPGESGITFLWYDAMNATGDVLRDSIRIVVNQSVNIAPLPDGTQDGPMVIDENTMRFTLFAPGKSFVYLLGEWNDFQISEDFYMNRTPDGNRWWIEVSDLEPGRDYAMQYLVDGSIRIGDPYSELVLDPFHDAFIPEETYPNLKAYPQNATGILTVVNTDEAEYPWQTTDFQPPHQEDLIIYELLIRDFLAAQNYETLIDTLDYLDNLGINAIELMPIQEFEGNNSWGYNPSYHMAVDKYYGTRDALKAFIDEAHRRGIAVYLDVVFNHAFSQSPLAQLYWDAAAFRPTAESPYLNVEARHPFNVGYDFNHESEATQTFVKRVLEHWIVEYRFDGFRFDLSKGFTQRFSTDNGVMSQYDQSRIDILTDYANYIWGLDPDNVVMLEHFADNDEERALAERGMLLWGNANHTFNQASMGYNFAGESDVSWIDYNSRGMNEPAVIGYMESHDEERMYFRHINFGNAQSGYDTREKETALERIGTAYNFMMCMPGPKMLWQFGELGMPYSINRCIDGSISPDCRLDDKPPFWDGFREEERIQLYDRFSWINQLRNRLDIFRTRDYDIQVFGPAKTLQLRSDTLNMVVAANFDMQELSVSPQFPSNGWWYDLVTGDSLHVDVFFQPVDIAAGDIAIFTDRKLDVRPITTSVLEAPESSVAWAVSPNPASHELQVSLPADLNRAELVIQDMNGNAFLREALSKEQTTIDVSELPKGLYAVQLMTEKGILSKKIVVQ